MFLKNSDQAKYGNLINTMNTEYAMGNDKFPKDVTKAVDIMANYKFDNAKKPYPKKEDNKKHGHKNKKKKEKMLRLCNFFDLNVQSHENSINPINCTFYTFSTHKN